MEFIPGDSLQQRLDRTGPLDLPEVLRIGRQLAEGLAAAHAQELIHRDIKPANVLIEGGPQHRVKITDFGLARAADDASISQSGVVAGTPMYMAPEQAKGETLDHRADLFSLGSVLYVMVTGRPPFRANSTLAVLKRVAEEEPRPIREIIPEVPAWFCRIVEKLHAKNPADRYSSAREVADVLADCESQLKAHGSLRDFSRIPGGGSPPRRPWRWKRLATTTALIALFIVSMAVVFSKNAIHRYASGSGELEILPAEGLVSVIVLKNDEGVLDGNKLHPHVTDWLGMKEPRRLTLPPGKYQLNVGTYPMGTEVSQWEVAVSGLFSSRQDWVAVVNTSAIITVERGQRVTLRPKMRPAPPPRPDPPPLPDPPPPPPSDGFVPLFNGTDLTGWKSHSQRADGWTVENNELVGRATVPNYLISDRDGYTDYHLRLEVKVNASGRGGHAARCASAPDLNGILACYAAMYGSGETGEINNHNKITPSTAPPVPPDTWFTHETILRGNRITVLVNGKPVAECVDAKKYLSRGRIGLGVWGNEGEAVVHIRKVEIKELPPSAEPAAAVDLLAKIDPARDALQGTWKRAGAALVSTPSAVAQLQVPHDLPPDYRLTMEVERTIAVGSLDFGLIVGGRTACVALDYRDGARSGIGGIDGKLLRKGEAVYEGRALDPGRNTVVAEVRGNRILVRVGDTTVIDWTGDPARLAVVPVWDKTDGKRLYVGHQNGGFRFHRLELTALPPPAPPAPAPAVLGPLRDLVAAKERARDNVKKRVEAGGDPPLVLIAAEVELIDARVRLAEATADKAGAVALLEELMTQRREEHRLIELRVKAGVAAADELNQADARLADAKARLAQARAALPPGDIPPPRPKE